TRTAAQVS
ncbi:na+/H+ antiporter family protein, partial [Vibrio parahaemolyticus V-223/04]